jgi:hypothetical protein
MKNVISDHKIDKLLGPSGTYAGFSLVIFGIIGLYFSLTITGLILIVVGMFAVYYQNPGRCQMQNQAKTPNARISINPNIQ